MERELKPKEAFYNSINSQNLNAALAAQYNASGDPNVVTLSAHFINRVFREGGYDFNFHLHTAKNPGSGHVAAPQKMSSEQQKAAVLAYVRRPDISILVINAMLLKPFWRLYLNKDHVPEILLKELLVILLDRYAIFNGAAQSGMVILLTGDLEGHACRLEAHLLEFAHLNKIEPEFLDWIEEANFFCNTFTGRSIPTVSFNSICPQ